VLPLLADPNAGQGFIAPGLTLPNGNHYDPNSPPKGAIKSSLDASDYPPFDPPPPPKPDPLPVTAKPGPYQGGSVYGVVVGDASPDGTIYQDATGKYVKHLKEWPWGVQGWWTKEP
jgi:hypothetical protein